MEVGHVAGSVGELVLGEQHRRPIGTAVIGGGLDAEVSLQALVEVVAGFGAGHEKAGGGERAKDALGEQTAFHAQPEQVEIGIVGDDGRVFEDVLERTEFISNGAEVDGPDGATLTAEGEQADVAFPRVESVAFALAVGFDVQGDPVGSGQVDGDAVEIAAEGAENPIGGLEDIGGCFPIAFIESF